MKRQIFITSLAAICMLQHSVPADAETKNQALEKQAKQYEADDTGRNIRDKDGARLTASDQDITMPSSDVELLARIRKEIVANDKLSTNGKNVKIILDQDTIFLRGPVASIEEKAWIEKTAHDFSSHHKVVNELEIAKG